MIRFLLAAVLIGLSGGAMSKTVLDIQGTDFTLNGKPAFLLGMSYYGGLGAPEAFLRRDLDGLKDGGFNWIRVWADWAGFGKDLSAVDGDGRPREPYLSRLKHLVDECDRRGMVVDVTFTRGNGENGSPRLSTQEAHHRAVATVIAALKPYRNRYLDLSNERNIGDARYASFDDLKALREEARRLDPDLPVTASQGGDIERDELEKYLRVANVDFITPHRPRGEDSMAETEAKSKAYRAWMKEIGREVPLHYQEPFRRGYASYNPSADDFITDLKGAMAGGAAGWCFHNGSTRDRPDGRPRRSFDLSENRLFDQLDSEELKAREKIKSLITAKKTG
jgi:hypothetical protein